MVSALQTRIILAALFLTGLLAVPQPVQAQAQVGISCIGPITLPDISDYFTPRDDGPLLPTVTQEQAATNDCIAQILAAVDPYVEAAMECARGLVGPSVTESTSIMAPPALGTVALPTSSAPTAAAALDCPNVLDAVRPVLDMVTECIQDLGGGQVNSASASGLPADLAGLVGGGLPTLAPAPTAAAAPAFDCGTIRPLILEYVELAVQLAQSVLREVEECVARLTGGQVEYPDGGGAGLANIQCPSPCPSGPDTSPPGACDIYPCSMLAAFTNLIDQNCRVYVPPLPRVQPCSGPYEYGVEVYYDNDPYYEVCVSIHNCPPGQVGAVVNYKSYCFAVPEPCESPEVGVEPTCVRPNDDLDGDGYGSGAESSAGSNPLEASSTPYTDDDGDGRANNAEPVTGANQGRALCTGAYGHVMSGGCGGYGTRPAGTAVNQNVVVTSNNRVYVFDSVCEPGALGNYETCKATSQRSYTSAKYSGDFVSDGYGWRRVA